MTTIALNMYQTAGIAMLLLVLGRFIITKSAFLQRCCIPAPVVGGLVFAIAHLVLYMAGILAMGFQVACQQSFMAMGQAKVSLLLACLRKLILLIPLIYILPAFIENKVLAVFLAEPVSDILAATVTVTVFLTQFNKILNEGAKKIGA